MDEIWPGREDRPRTVYCSCGKEATIYLRDDRRKFITMAEGWVYKSGRGWHCGAEGHQQVYKDKKEEK